jgi:hypothetical protein
MEIRAGKTFRTKEERLAIIEETLDPKASVAQVALKRKSARRYDRNAPALDSMTCRFG